MSFFTINSPQYHSKKILFLGVWISTLLSACTSTAYKQAKADYEYNLYKKSPQYAIDQQKQTEQAKIENAQRQQYTRNKCLTTPMAEQGFEYGTKGHDIANINLFKKECDAVQVKINDQLWRQNYQKGLKENYCRVQNAYYVLWESYQLRCKPLLSTQQFALAQELSNRAVEIKNIRREINTKREMLRKVQDDLTRSYFKEEQKQDMRIKQRKLRYEIDLLEQRESLLEQSNQNLIIRL